MKGVYQISGIKNRTPSPYPWQCKGGERKPLSRARVGYCARIGVDDGRFLGKTLHLYL